MTKSLATREFVARLELAGIDLWQVEFMNVSFYGLIPANPRLGAWEGPLPLFYQSPSRRHPTTRWDPAILWDAVDAVSMEFDTPERCLWEFVSLANAPDESFVSFVAKWGLPRSTFTRDDDETLISNREGAWSIDALRTEARRLAAALLTLTATDDGAIVALDQLMLLAFSPSDPAFAVRTDEEADDWDQAVAERLTELDVDEVQDLRGNHWRQWRDAESSEERLEYQRLTVVDFVGELAGAPTRTFRWSSTGRSDEPFTLGTDMLVGEYFRQIFRAPTLDVFQCSICGLPFPFDESSGKRRPRRDRRRYCSEVCRLEGRRETRRRSWRRNGSRWRQSRSGDDR